MYYTWPGTDRGCHCRNGDVEKGTCCTNNKDNSDCNTCKGNDILPIEPRNLTIWSMVDG